MAGTALESQIAAATAAILLPRFTSRPIPEICAMGGITLEDFSKSVAYREIFGLGEAPATRKDVTPLNRKPGGLMEQSNASLQRGDEG
ncbi:MAG: hypothetical protein NTZ40_11595 [Cyanobacteria bacterium]|nr:hypothetical protein [Cyanobacteriota bacterium]